jgi:hypothetical protein
MFLETVLHLIQILVKGKSKAAPVTVRAVHKVVMSRLLHFLYKQLTDPEARVRFSALPEKKVVGLELGPLSLVSTTEELLDRKVAVPVYKTENTAVGIRHADHVAPSIGKSWQSLRLQAARSLDRCSTLADSDHGVS